MLGPRALREAAGRQLQGRGGPGVSRPRGPQLASSTSASASSSSRRRAAPCLRTECSRGEQQPTDSRDDAERQQQEPSLLPIPLILSKGTPVHPEMQEGEEFVVLPGCPRAFSLPQPSGWLLWDQQRSRSGTASTAPTVSCEEEFGDFGDSVSLSHLPPPCNTPTTEDDFDAEHAAGFSRSAHVADGCGVGGSSDGGASTSGAAALAGAALAVSSGLAAAGRADLWTVTDQPGIDMFLAGPVMCSQLKQVFVILFGVGERDTEGIYSLRAFSEEGLPQETIIAFEAEEDAQRYAGLLEATMDHLPAVCTIAPRELLDFCLDHGYNCRLEPADSLLIPPDYNVGITDWERSLRLRDGQWAVSSAEPDCSGSSSAGGAEEALGNGGGWQTPGGLLKPSGGTAIANLRTKTGINSSTLARYTGMSEGELETIRVRLERLLPADS